jgi:hypothetical protein
MQYFELKHTYPKDTIFCYEKNFPQEGEYFHKGKKIINWNPKNTVHYYEYYEPEDYLHNSAFFFKIFSSKIKSATEELGIKNVQFLPIKIISPDGYPELKNYFILNLLTFLDALDLEHSKYREIIKTKEGEKVIMGLTKYVLKKDVVKDYDIFSLTTDKQVLFVSKRLKKLLKKKKVKGISFEKVKIF